MWTAEQGLWGILLPAEKKACFGGGRLAIPCGGQRGKRPALGNPSSPGKSGIHAALIFAAAKPQVQIALCQNEFSVHQNVQIIYNIHILDIFPFITGVKPDRL